MGKYVRVVPFDKSTLYIAEKPIEIKTYARKSYKPRKAPKDLSEVYYKVKSGDNLGFISSWYNVSVNDIMYWNGLHSSRINIAQNLVIYVPNDKVKYYKAVNTLSFAKKQARVGKTVVPDKKPKTSPKKKKTSTSSKGWVYYTVKSGDSPYTIAKKYNGVGEDDIMKLNGITNPRGLKVGQRLKIKKK